MAAACALTLANLCVPAAYAAAAEQVGVGATRPADPAAVRRLGVKVQVFMRSLTRSATLNALNRSCVGSVCVAYRTACAPGGLSCTYEEWPIARRAWRAVTTTVVPLQEIRLEAASPAARRAAEQALAIAAGRRRIPLARLTPSKPQGR